MSRLHGSRAQVRSLTILCAACGGEMSHIYRAGAGLAYDRNWMIVKEEKGKFVTQRGVPKYELARTRPGSNDAELILDCQVLLQVGIDRNKHTARRSETVKPDSSRRGCVNSGSSRNGQARGANLLSHQVCPQSCLTGYEHRAMSPPCNFQMHLHASRRQFIWCAIDSPGHFWSAKRGQLLGVSRYSIRSRRRGSCLAFPISSRAS